MSPGLLAILLIACLLALIPVWRLRVAGWRPGALLTAWLAYTVAILLAVRFAAVFRLLLPILVLAYVAPFVAGPERLARVMGRRSPARRPVIDVTPRPPVGLPEPPRDVTPGTDDADAPADADDLDGPGPRGGGR